MSKYLVRKLTWEHNEEAGIHSAKGLDGYYMLRAASGDKFTSQFIDTCDTFNYVFLDIQSEHTLNTCKVICNTHHEERIAERFLTTPVEN